MSFSAITTSWRKSMGLKRSWTSLIGERPSIGLRPAQALFSSFPTAASLLYIILLVLHSTCWMVFNFLDRKSSSRKFCFHYLVILPCYICISLYIILISQFFVVALACFCYFLPTFLLVELQIIQALGISPVDDDGFIVSFPEDLVMRELVLAVWTSSSPIETVDSFARCVACRTTNQRSGNMITE